MTHRSLRTRTPVRLGAGPATVAALTLAGTGTAAARPAAAGPTTVGPAGHHFAANLTGDATYRITDVTDPASQITVTG